MATKLLLLALGLAASFCATAKTDSLPPINDLLHSLEIYYQKQTQAQLTEYQISEKGKWLKYISNVSMGYNLGTSPEGNLKNILRPAISFNTNTLYQVRQDAKYRTATVIGARTRSTTITAIVTATSGLKGRITFFAKASSNRRSVV